MSYDICFWKEKPGAEVDVEQLLNDLADTVEFPGLAGLPLDSVRQAFQYEFPEVTGGAGHLEWEGDGSYFEANFTFLDERTVSLISVSCGYNLLKSPNALKKLEKVAMSLGCRIYDLQK